MENSVIPLASGEAHLWYILAEKAENPELHTEYLALLSDAERERYERYHFDKDRILYLLTRVLIRTTLSRYANLAPEAWEFEENHYGKPHLASPPADAAGLSFNLTNTQGLVALLITRDIPVGVDAEYLNRPVKVLSLADRFFSPDEVQDLHSQDPARQEQRFLRYWTLKESYIKARGKGLSIPLDSFSMILHPDTIAITLHNEPGSAKEWQFEQRILPSQHLVAMAFHRGNAADFTITLHETLPLRGSLP